jgi:hypothetical protein
MDRAFQVLMVFTACFIVVSADHYLLDGALTRNLAAAVDAFF